MARVLYKLGFINLLLKAKEGEDLYREQANLCHFMKEKQRHRKKKRQGHVSNKFRHKTQEPEAYRGE